MFPVTVFLLLVFFQPKITSLSAFPVEKKKQRKEEKTKLKQDSPDGFQPLFQKMFVLVET